MRDSRHRPLLGIAPGLVLVVAAAVVVLLAWRGQFQSMAAFPRIFALAISAAALLACLSPRGTRLRAAALAVLAATLAWGAVGAHLAFIARERTRAEQQGRETWVGRNLPAIDALATLNAEAVAGSGTSYPLDSGDVLLNVWATWCSPCVEEMPLIEAFWQARRADGIRVVGLTRDWDRNEATVREFLTEQGVTYPVLVVDDATYGQLGIERLPTTLWLRDGVVRDYRVSIDGTRELIEAIGRGAR